MPFSFLKTSGSGKSPRRSRSFRESIRNFTRASRSLNDVQSYTTSMTKERSMHPLPRPQSVSDRVRSSSDGTFEKRARRVSADEAIAAWCCCDAAHAANLFFVHSQYGLSRDRTPMIFNDTKPVPSFVRSTTCEQLRKPDRSGFVEREVVVECDSTGFGFTLRGGAPVHVFTVDPIGPASKAGLRVGDFILNMNGFDVLDSTHFEVAKLCVRGPRKAYIIVLSHPLNTGQPRVDRTSSSSLNGLAGYKATAGLLHLKRSISRSLGSLVRDNILDSTA